MNDSGLNSRRELATLLRSCVQCGLCLPHCATWLATGNEVQSPRGRLVLLEDVLGSRDPCAATPDAYLAAFDQCIGCRACETACPSGVPFSLLEHGQELARDWAFRSDTIGPRPSVPRMVLERLDSPKMLRLLSRVAGAIKSVLVFALGHGWRRRLDQSSAGIGNLVRLVGSVPYSAETDGELCRLLDPMVESTLARMSEHPVNSPADPALGESPSVAFFRGCANQALLPGTSRRLLSLLRSIGCRVDIPDGQDCCGALASHRGRPDRAARLQATNRNAFQGAVDSGATILVEAAGCGLELKESLGDFTGSVDDAVDLLSRWPLPALGPVPLRVVVHDPCHARHGQGIYRQPRDLLARVPGLILVEAPEGEVCCGSGGAWCLRYPELSDQLGRRKARNLASTGADLVVTSNPGCLGQIADGLALVAPELPILPLTDLLWYAANRCRWPHS